MQSSVERPCPGESVTFTCTVSSLAHVWRVSDLSITETLVPANQGQVLPDPPFEFNVTEVIPGENITTTATVIATISLNGTLVSCEAGIGSLPGQSSTINLRGECVVSVVIVCACKLRIYPVCTFELKRRRADGSGATQLTIKLLYLRCISVYLARISYPKTN